MADLVSNNFLCEIHRNTVGKMLLFVFFIILSIAKIAGLTLKLRY